MSKEKKLEPKLRFREFEDCDVWNSYKLGNTTQILTGGTPSTKVEDYWYPKEIPWMASGEINKKRLFKTDNLISNNGFENSSATWIKEKSVLIALAGQGKTRGTVAINEIPLTTNQSIAAILPFKNKIYPEFLFQNLDNRYEELRLVSSGDGTRGGLNKEIISELQVKAPNILEQKMIGNFFKKIDKMIQLQQSKVNKVKDLKSAYLSEMFPKEGEKYPKKRFEGFTEPWIEYSLERLGDIVGGNSWKSNEYDKEGSHLIITIANVSGDYYVDINEGNKITPNNNRYVLSEGDILISMTGNVGRVSRMPEVKAVLNQRVGKLVINSGIDKEFIFTMLQNKKFERSMILQGQGAAQLNISRTDILDYRFKIPEYNEQKKIGQLFKNINDQISVEEEKLAKLEKLKQAYLNDMFV